MFVGFLVLLFWFCCFHVGTRTDSHYSKVMRGGMKKVLERKNQNESNIIVQKVHVKHISIHYFWKNCSLYCDYSVLIAQAK